VNRIFLFVILVFSFLPSKAVVKDPTPIPGINKIWIYGNTKNPSSVVIILSGDGGWVLGVVKVAKTLAKQNALVIGVSSMPYIRYLRKQDVPCYSISSDIENLSKYIQTQCHLHNYMKPVILGYSLGATLSYGTIAQAASNTYQGVIALGFCKDLELPKPLCKGAGLESTKRIKNGYDLLPDTLINDPFIILKGENDRMCKYCLASEFIDKMPHAKIIKMNNIRHGSLGLKKWIPQILETYHEIVNRIN
jgi:type IV secretory pathway VirJ component